VGARFRRLNQSKSHPARSKMLSYWGEHTTMRIRSLLILSLVTMWVVIPARASAAPAGYYLVTDLGVFATSDDVVFNPVLGITSFNDADRMVLNRIGDDGTLPPSGAARLADYPLAP